MANNNDPDFLSTLRDRLLDSEQADKFFLNPGTIVGDEYVVEDKIAEGGSGYVYRCHRRSEPGSIYALKVTYPKSVNAARRFQAEVNASYEVKHINVLRSIDCIFHGSALAYVMEYAPGGDLRDILDREEEIKVPAFLIIAKQLVSGLSAIHRKNIVHRDIKPENILFSKEGHLKIADFGISYSTELSRVTANGSLVGTINYMAPEYVRRGVFDERSDLFSLGIMLYELLTQQMPYGYAKSLEELVRKISNSPQPVSDIRADVPIRLSNVIAKLLAPDPDERYQSAEEVGMDIMQIEEEMILKELPDVVENYLQASELACLYEEKTINWFHFLYFVFLSIITTSLLLLVIKITGI